MPRAFIHRAIKTFFPVGFLSALLLMLASCADIIHVTTSEPMQVNPNKRSLGTKIDDQQLETIAAVNIKKASTALEHAHINIDSFNGIVLLTGQVSDEQLQALAGDTVSKIYSVRQVHNELTVGSFPTLKQRSYDAWLTSKIKTKLVASSNIQSRRIHILTEAKTVFLMGLVSRYEADKITDVVSRTGGVTGVVKVFEYID